MVYGADLLSLRIACKLKLLHLTGKELTKKLQLKDTRKKHYSQANHLVRLQESFCLNANTRTGCWRSNSRT
jgi:hypothetical protein